MNDKLICYFSATGTTKKIAESLVQTISGDLFEIIPEQEYTTSDLDWTNKQSRTTLEMNDENSRPAIKYPVENLERYNKIYLGFPVWWYKEPTIIDTFIEQNNLENKQIFIFVTSGGSTASGSFKHLKEKYSNLNFIDAKTLNHIDEQTINDWI